MAQDWTLHPSCSDVHRGNNFNCLLESLQKVCPSTRPLPALFSAIMTAIQLALVKYMWTCGHVVVKHPKGCIVAAALIEYSVWATLFL